MFELKSYLDNLRNIIDDHIFTYVNRDIHATRIVEAMNYSLQAGGKRIRPILCLAAEEAVSKRYGSALPAACAIEMIHTYSLIHDDLPAMDDDMLRRGKPTSHIQFDEATAILTGDALLTLAFEVLASAGAKSKMEEKQKWFEVTGKIADSAGYSGMIEGQMRDMISEGMQLEKKTLEQLHQLKTGKLIEAALYAGAKIGNAATNQIDALIAYGQQIGLAFQVMDDILNITGDPALMGKAVGTDEARLKNTYPLLIGLDKSEVLAEKLINNALSLLDIFGTSADPLRKIARYIIERNR